MNLKEKIHFYFEDIETPLGRAVDFFIMGLVIVASFIFVLQTYDLSPEMRQITGIAEAAIMSIFVLEYALRFAVSENKLRHSLNIYSLIDFLTIFPFIFSLFIPWQLSDFIKKVVR